MPVLDCLWACGLVMRELRDEEGEASGETVSERAKTAWDSDESKGGGEIVS